MPESDPDLFAPLHQDLIALVEAWRDRGVSSRAAWSALAVFACGVARNAGIAQDGALAIIKQAWDYAERANTPKSVTILAPGGDA